MIYLVPPLGDDKELSSRAKLSRLPLFVSDTVRDFLIMTSDSPHSVVRISASALELIGGYPQQLVQEMPTVITGVPGMTYELSWVTKASLLPGISWLQFSEMFAKSGHVVLRPGQARDNEASPLDVTDADLSDTDEGDGAEED